MTIRDDESIEINLIDAVDGFNSRTEVRSFVLNKWIEETAEHKYRYFVETLNNNGRIYLERPGRLNKGCDFVIYIENQLLWRNGNDRPPDHGFILDDLREKQIELPAETWTSLLTAINKIYNCLSYNEAIGELVNLNYAKGHSFEMILKTLKWLFIEQDITYWSGRGRAMLWDEINTIGGN